MLHNKMRPVKPHFIKKAFFPYSLTQTAKSYDYKESSTVDLNLSER